jgi:hypothetical protein
MAATTDRDDFQLAFRVYTGEVRNPCMINADMTVSVYSALIDLYDQGARGAARLGNLRLALELDQLMQSSREIVDGARRCTD